MDNGRKRFRFDDTGASAASALRRLTRAQTGHRLSIRRASAALSDSSSSSSVSVTSLEPDQQSTCVFRQTSGDECAIHRFIVWTAVKRNVSTVITGEEKRECPLLRCRMRFPTHELMLCHLYSCPHIASGEYWCYDCGKAERIADNSKCRRCVGHPSRRRKIMSMARNLFSSLGHKSRADDLPNFDLPEPVSTTPTYEDNDIDFAGVELYSTEIHEIDSSEVPLETIPESADEEVDVNTLAKVSKNPRPPTSVPSTSSESPPSPSLLRPLLEQDPSQHLMREKFSDNPMATMGPPATVSPMNLLKRKSVPDRQIPSLQLGTSSLDKARPRRRGSLLAPSSSVRSTSSTSSTNSTQSTSSVSSYCISPISTWSIPCGLSTDFDSAICSPADEPGTPASLLPADMEALVGSLKPAKNDFNDFDKDVMDSLLSELPAEMPILDVLPTHDDIQGTLGGMDESAFQYHSAMSGEMPLESAFTLASHPTSAPPPSRFTLGSTIAHRVRAPSLVESVQVALEMHIAESMAKLKNVSGNHLADQLRSLSPSQVAVAGLDAMNEILQGRLDSSPIKLVCFIHLVYSLSLVIREQDALSCWANLFRQALAYSTWLPYQDRQAYMSVVYCLWKPNDMSDEAVVRLLHTGSPSPSVAQDAWKGKETERMASIPISEPLVFVAQYFLDELELATLQDEERPEIQASDLSVQHLKDINIEIHNNPQFEYTVKYVIQILIQQYADISGFVASMRAILARVDSIFSSTARRLELELLKVGKMTLPSRLYFDDYIQRVRIHVDSLYAQNVTVFNPRLTYYQHGINLMRYIIAVSGRNGAQPISPTGQALNPMGYMSPISENMSGFHYEGMFPGSNTRAVPNVIVDPPATSSTAWRSPDDSASSDTGSRAPSTPAAPTSSGGTVTGLGSTSSSLAKVESDSCCDICGYRPKGDPQWFRGSMAKHKKLQHASSPPEIYRCPYPGCTSQYKNRRDNLRQHQIEKGHFVEGQNGKRSSKRKKTDD